MNLMRIMHLLNHCYDGNGHVNVAVDLACAQAAEGHEVVVASAGGPYVTHLRSHHVRHADLPAITGRINLMTSARRLVAEVRHFEPNVLHAHMVTSALQGVVAARIVGVPLVTTVHNSFDRYSTLMRVGSVVVAVSQAERALLLSRGYPGDRLVTVLNGPIGSPRASWASDVIGSLLRPSVMTLSGLHRRKAVNDVIDAFAAILPAFPQWHLNIVGDGPDREQLEGRVRTLGLTESVHVLGSTLNPGPLLRQSEIFASGSLAEPFGLAVAEARAAGCAVVATAVGGVPEVVDHGAAGLLSPPADPPAMAANLRRLMSSPTTLAAWRSRARAGSDRFSVRRMTADYLTVYQDACSRVTQSARHRHARLMHRTGRLP
jgi:glycosyltransferase involved in cell wall biosynthesis